MVEVVAQPDVGALPLAPKNPLPYLHQLKALVLFMLVGHDTTSTTLSYALWALGHHPDIQGQVYAEVTAPREPATEPRRCAQPRLHRPRAT